MKDTVFGNIYLTGNTIIDSLLLVADSNPKIEIKNFDIKTHRLLLVTIHRRENWGSKIESILLGLKKLLEKNKNVFLLLPMHPNKLVREPIKRILGENSRVSLQEPLDYKELIAAIKISYFLITDSGGLQEEAPSLGKPVLIIRETTERKEAINAGASKLIGTKSENVFKEANNLLKDEETYQKMSRSKNPFGDGKASERILKVVKNFLKID